MHIAKHRLQSSKVEQPVRVLCLLALILVSIPVTSTSAAHPGVGQFSPIQIGLVEPVQIIPKEISIYGVSVGLLHARNYNVYGINVALFSEVDHNGGILQVAPFWNHVGNNFFGTQLSLYENRVRGDFYGIQTGTGLRFFIAFADFLFNNGDMTGDLTVGNAVGGDMIGLQIAPFANNTLGNFAGLQLGLVNLNGGLTGIQAGLYNRSGGNVTGLQFSLWNHTLGDVIGIQVGILGNDSRDNAFLQFSAIKNTARNVLGLQITGIFNDAEGSVQGLQAALLNFSGSFLPFQLGLVGINRGDGLGLQANLLYQESGTITGAQVGIINAAETVSGTQIGLINLASHCSGVQIGLYNRTDTMHGVQIGGLNIIRKGTLYFMFGINASFK